MSRSLKFLKRFRIFEHLPVDAEISFLTKDIPTGFIEFMANKIRDQIHIQSHVPDFTSEKMAGASGIAIQRLVFDFENMVSSVEADFDLGLLERIRLINLIYTKKRMLVGTNDDFTISHKRNMPLNLKEFAETAKTMKEAGFSAWLCADIMPDDVIPDVQAELRRQKEEAEAMVGGIEDANFNEVIDESNQEIMEDEEILEDAGV
jgi:SPP1 family phage portal protein